MSNPLSIIKFKPSMNSPQLHAFPLPAKTGNSVPATLYFWRSGESNLGYFLRPGKGRGVVGIDVPNGREMTKILQGEGWTLSTLLLTHTHHDHVNGLRDLVKQTGCEFVSPEPFDSLPRRHVDDGMSWEVEGFTVVAWNSSGHSPCDISYLFPELDLCFCGDTLFAWGCGRMFAGPPERLWASLLRLRSLPDATRMCCGHDYREDNARFIEGELKAWGGADEAVRRIRAELNSAPDPAPFPIGDQKRSNPFLRADDPEIARCVGRAGAGPVEVFAELRARRNRF